MIVRQRGTGQRETRARTRTGQINSQGDASEIWAAAHPTSQEEVSHLKGRERRLAQITDHLTDSVTIRGDDEIWWCRVIYRDRDRFVARIM